MMLKTNDFFGCKFCHNNVPSDSRYCPFCGRPLIPANESGQYDYDREDYYELRLAQRREIVAEIDSVPSV